MRTKKLFPCALIFLCFSSWVWSQSLVELSKKEKERRAKVKQKTSIVITNVDLLKKKSTPALESKADKSTNSAPTEAEAVKEDGAKEPEKIEPEAINQIDEASVAELKDNWDRSEEFVSLLALRIRELLQKFYSTGDIKLKEDLQKQMNEISLQLEKAEKEAEKAQEEYELAKAALEKKKRI